MTQAIDTREALETHRRALLAGTARALGLLKRVPEFMRKRGWPSNDQDLVAVLTAAIICRKWNAGRTRIRRPEGANYLQDLWPAEASVVTANHIVDTLELDDLLEPG